MADCLHDLLQCSICLERFTQPKMLPCQHTFCRHCLRDITTDDKTLSCPQCRVEHLLPKGGVDGLMDNMTIKTLLNMVSKERGDSLNPIADEESECSDCGFKRSLGECEHCKESICEECRASHTRILNEIEKLIKFKNHGDEAEGKEEKMEERSAALVKKITEKKEEMAEIFNNLHKSIAEREENLSKFLDLLEKRVNATESEEAKSKFTDKVKDVVSACKTVSSLETYRKVFDFMEKGLASYQLHPETGLVFLHHDITGIGKVKFGNHVTDTCLEGSHSLRRSNLDTLPKNVDYSVKDLYVIDKPPEGAKKIVPECAVYSRRLGVIFCVSEGRVLMYGLESLNRPSLLSTYITACTHIAVTDSGKAVVAAGATVHIFDCMNIQIIKTKIGSRNQRLEIKLDSVKCVDQICCFGKEFALLAQKEKTILIFSEEGYFIREFPVEEIASESRLTVDQNGQIFMTGNVSIKQKKEAGELKGDPESETRRKPSQLLVAITAQIYVYTWTGQRIRNLELPNLTITFHYEFNGTYSSNKYFMKDLREEDSVPNNAQIQKNSIGGICVDGDGFLSLAVWNQIRVFQKPEVGKDEESIKLVAVTSVGKHMAGGGWFGGQLGGISLMPNGKMIVCEKEGNRLVIL